MKVLARTIDEASSRSRGPFIRVDCVAIPTASTGRAALADAMRRHIESALRRCHGRIEGGDGAGQMPDINPHTLRARMRKLGIDWKRFRGPAARG